MFGSFVRPLLSRVIRTFEAAGPVAGGREFTSLLDAPLTPPAGAEFVARLIRKNVYPADLQKAA